MPLRLLEVTVPYEELEGFPALLKEIPILHLWTSGSPDSTGQARVLLRAEDTEALSDLVVRRFGSRKDFRLVLFPVEGTLPRAEEPEAPGPAEEEKPNGAAKQRISREELRHKLEEAGRLTTIYLVMVVISTVVAAIGLIRNDIAIVIGAMVIAPLLGPNVALALGSALGDTELARRSLKALGAGVAAGAVVSLALGAILGFDPAGQILAARTRPELGDIALALAAGTAGALAFTSGVPTVVVGVMVAVALLPPLVAAGLHAGAGLIGPARGALILFLINVTCVNLAAAGTFFIQKVRPGTWWEADRAKKATRLAVATWISLLILLLALILLGGV